MSSSSTTTQTTHNRRQLYRLTNGILDAHAFHFITISLLFIPFTFAASAAAQFYSSSGTTDVATMFDPFNLFLIKTIISSSQTLLTLKTLVTLLAFFCFIILPTVAGVALITYSANQAIHRKPLTFSSTLKSLSSSYIPTLYMFIAGSVTLVIVFLAFTLSPIAVTEAIKALLGFDSGDHLLFYVSIFVNMIVSYALAFAIVFFIVIWGSAAAITVLESKSGGFETLRQSANQSNEFRRHSFSIVYITGFGIIPALLWSPTAKWMLILHVGAVYLQTSLMIALYVVANTVLYAQCKVASREETTATTVVKGEVSGEYVRLLVVNDDKEGDDVHEDDLAKWSGRGGFSYMFYLLLVVWIILLFGIFLFPLN